MRGLATRHIVPVAALVLGPALFAGEAAPPAGEAAAGAGTPPVLRLHTVAEGRFAVIAPAGQDGARLAELAASAWSEWREPLGLPSRLPSSITVRLVPEDSWSFGPRPARVTAEPGGVVSVWIRNGGEAGIARERRWLGALAEGALRRKMFLIGADGTELKAPAWLGAAAAEAVLVAERPAMLDAWQAEMRGAVRPASLRKVLLWEPDGGEGRAEAAGAYGLWLWLREAGARSGAWQRFTEALLRGEAPGAVLAREYRGLAAKPAEAREWELAWRVAGARLARLQATPSMEAADSRRRLERLSRITVFDTKAGVERALPAWGEWLSRREDWPARERGERLRVLAAEMDRVHPFYRNAALSLGRAWTALSKNKEDEWREASADWARDMEAGRELETASAKLLDEIEGPGTRPAPGRPE